MSTTIDRNAKTAKCDIFLGSDYASVKSPTGKTLVAMIGEDSDWSALSTDEVKLLGKLRDASTTELILTFSELKTFQSLAQRFPDMGTTPAPTPATAGANEGKEVEAISITPTPAQETTSPVVPTIAPSVVVAPANKPHNASNGHTTKIGTDQTAGRIHSDVRGRAVINPERLEAKLDGLHKVATALKEEVFYQLEYDIPTSLQNVCPNPTWRRMMTDELGIKWSFRGMWHYGFRRTLSCWVIPARMMETDAIKCLLAHWERHGANTRRDFKVEVIKYASDQADYVRKRAGEELDACLREVHTSLIVNIDEADKRLQTALAQLETAENQPATLPETAGLNGNAAAEQVAVLKSEQQLVNARNNTVRSEIIKAGEKLEATIKSAELFDVTDTVADLLNAFRQSIIARAEAYNLMAQEAGIKLAPLPK